MSINKYCVIGNPIARSKSPNIYNYLYKLFNINSHYSRLNIIDVHHINETVELLNLCGINVTMPYKQTAFSLADAADTYSQSTEASNTLIFDDTVYAFNTDYLGFHKTLQDNSINLNGKSVLIIGAGNTAGTVINAISKENCRIDVINRSSQNVEILRNFYPNLNHITATELKNNYDLVINTSPDTDFLSETTKLINTNTVMDFNYTAPHLKSLLPENCKYISGLELLINQALYAYNLYSTFSNAPKISVDDKSLFNSIFNELKSSFDKSKNISLIGFSGSGKSTIGKIIAEKLNMKFISTDDLIVERSGMKIKDIFKSCGEAKFREIENDVLITLKNVENSVISSGGGICANSDNIETLKNMSYCVFLLSKIEDIFERVQNEDRPLTYSLNIHELKHLFDSRLDNYFKCSDLIVYNNGNIEKISEIIASELQPIICL